MDQRSVSLCPITTVVFGILQQSEKLTCAYSESLITSMYEAKRKPIPGSERRFLSRLFKESPYVEYRINVALVAKFLRLRESVISRKFLVLFTDDELDPQTKNELMAVAVGMVRAIQRNDLEHSVQSKSASDSLLMTSSSSVLSYLSASSFCSASSLGCVLFRLTPAMSTIINDVEARCFTLLSTASRYRDFLLDSFLDRCHSSYEEQETQDQKLKSSSEDLDLQTILRKQSLDTVRATLFDAATKKRIDCIDFVRGLSQSSKTLLQQPTGFVSGVHFLLATFSNAT